MGMGPLIPHLFLRVGHLHFSLMPALGGEPARKSWACSAWLPLVPLSLEPARPWGVNGFSVLSWPGAIIPLLFEPHLKGKGKGTSQDMGEGHAVHKLRGVCQKHMMAEE